ncbi:hypothetical protein MLD38_027284 [Melastoma candidum]|uniref:Uncharacterized protein n=1 Tax=Melastoma candidum TaxID=119954 RepID=A0ACB9P424_9MYRT|nr:hypothetical protein MLD38_027284 [Melastoma candidum]
MEGGTSFLSSIFDPSDFFRRPSSLSEALIDLVLCAVPIWLSVMIGLLIGWSWRPRWTTLVYLGLRSRLRLLLASAAAAPSIFGARRLWLAFTALSAFSALHAIWSSLGKGNGKDVGFSVSSEGGGEEAESPERQRDPAPDLNIGGAGRVADVVTEGDFEHLLQLLSTKEGDIEWQNMMDRSTPNMAYEAWRHEPKTGPSILRSRTVFEDASPDLVRDFFWDDGFRPKWDPMLTYFKTLEECPNTGSTIVHWIKKFPFFCSDREYIIGKRIWEAGRTYYCVTKGVSHPSIQRRDKPRRVDLYFSSWVIRAVQSLRGDGQFTACEVSFVHYEDMGIPKDVAKLGVRHGMWGTVKKLHSGMRAYQNARKSEASLSRSVLMARITTKISSYQNLESLGMVTGDENDGGCQTMEVMRRGENGIDWKWVVLGGTVAVVLGLRSGMVGRMLVVGAGGRVARR